MPSMDESTREKWVHEDDLINHRLSWLGVTQGLLFTALGFALHEQATLPKGAPASSLLRLLVDYLPLLGLATSACIFIGVLGAIIAMWLIAERQKLKLGISPYTTAMGWTCAIGIPFIFIAAWIFVLVAI